MNRERFKDCFVFVGRPVSVNNMHFQIGRRRVLTSEYRKYKELIKACVSGRKLPEGVDKVKVKLSYIQPDNRRRDVDNIIKPILDGITQAGYWKDDSIVFKIEAEKLRPNHYPRVVCYIEEVFNEEIRLEECREYV